MKKLSKLTALVLALAMAFALASCGGNSASTTGSASKSEQPAVSASGSGDKSAADASDAESDLQYVKDKGTLVVGITDFEPMDYKDENGQWIGFDADMAKVVAEKLGVEVQFVVIDWDNKIMELDSKNVDVLWNGMTLTDEVKNSMECTNPYFNNAQVVVTAGK